MIFLKGFASLAVLAAAGTGPATLLFRRSGPVFLPVFLGCSFVLGFGVTGLTSVVVMLSGGRIGPWLFLTCGAFGILWALWARPQLRPPSLGRPSAGTVMVGILAGIAVLMAGLGEDAGWDFTAFWSLKAKSLERYGTFRNPDFTEDLRPHGHPRYPLLVPAVHSWIYSATGSFSERWIRLTMAAFFVSSLAVVHGALRETLGERATPWAVALYASTPSLLTAESGGALSGYCDYPLAIFALAAIVQAARWLETGETRAAGAAALALACAGQTKDEGGLVVAATVLALVGTAAGRREGWRRIVCAALLPAAGETFVALWMLASRGLLPDPAHVTAGTRLRWEWFPEVLRSLVSQLVRFKEWSFFWGIAALVLATAPPRLREPRSLLIFVPTMVLLAYLFVWMYFPADTPKAIMRHNVNRLVLHLFPLVFVWVAGRVFDLSWGPLETRRRSLFAPGSSTS